jgi:hypothetical protein
MAGINILDFSHDDIEVEQEAPDPDRLGLDLLAAITELRTRGISDVAVIICVGAATPIPLERLQSQLFARCIAASLEPFTTWTDMTMQVTRLTDAIRSAVDSIRGITYLVTRSEEHQAASPGVTRHFEVASSPSVGANDAQGVSDALYSWTLATLKLDPNVAAVTQHRKARDPSSLPRQHPDLALNSNWRAEAARTRIALQENLRYLQKQWDAMLLDLEERDESRASRVRARLAIRLIASDGNLVDSRSALRAARSTWHLLDKPARYRWLDAWNQVFPPKDLHTHLSGSSSTALALSPH